MDNLESSALDREVEECERCLNRLEHEGNWFGVSTKFYTDAAIYEFATLTKIKKVLQLDPTLQHVPENEKLAESIYKDARKLFVIFLIKRLPMSFLQLLVTQHQINDDCFPLLPCYTLASSTQANSSTRVAQYQQMWGSLHFKEGIFHEVRLVKSLPVKYVEQRGKGSAGTVHVIRIHNDCFKFPSAAPGAVEGQWSRRFAMKVITNTEIIKREKSFLEALKSHAVTHPNLLPSYCSFHCENKFYVISELADRDLNDLFQDPRSNYDTITVDWLRTQIAGLADALKSVHNVKPGEKFGYLHDIKPRNILVYGAPSYVLKFADWSCAGVNGLTEAGGSHKSAVWGNPTYLPPECDKSINEPEPKSSRPHDIWSLGCLFLELLVWFTETNTGVDKFRGERVADADADHSSDAFHRKRMVKKSVEDKMLGISSSNVELQPFIDVIESMLQIDPLHRPDAKKVANLLLSI